MYDKSCVFYFVYIVCFLAIFVQHIGHYAIESYDDGPGKITLWGRVLCLVMNIVCIEL